MPKAPIRLASAVLRPIVLPSMAHIVDTVLCTQRGVDALEGQPFVDETRDMLWTKLEAMPELFGVGMMGMTLAFSAYAGARGGRSLAAQDLAQRQARLDEWRSSPVGLLRSFTQFYEKMGTFVYYSHVEEAESPHGDEVH